MWPARQAFTGALRLRSLLHCHSIPLNRRIGTLPHCYTKIHFILPALFILQWRWKRASHKSAIIDFLTFYNGIIQPQNSWIQRKRCDGQSYLDLVRTRRRACWRSKVLDMQKAYFVQIGFHISNDHPSEEISWITYEVWCGQNTHEIDGFEKQNLDR